MQSTRDFIKRFEPKENWRTGILKTAKPIENGETEALEVEYELYASGEYGKVRLKSKPNDLSLGEMLEPDIEQTLITQNGSNLSIYNIFNGQFTICSKDHALEIISGERKLL